MQKLKAFAADEGGQDMVEYTLLLAFVCLASAALFIGAGKQVSGIWGGANNLLSTANATAKNGSS